jgi:hypothetical protein
MSNLEKQFAKYAWFLAIALITSVITFLIDHIINR